ncbi:hypothetical protein [Pseudohongiella spirulinae]|uniref:Glycosyltransferase RgtA/B/C/D-like domain-containing protein n=1 Tax=Pseudohongiella spirulinae TaxID=1249552 RepID=A0A0S2KAB3_9GAMM|nr:hypothetical protein [Pseudohongiella spirulinae]ALO45259.1 hypothetical protein PS2015_576 [Pseudohongiella spirulinae]
MSRTLRMMLAALALAGLTLVVNFGVLSGSWRWDDPQVLLHAHQFSWLQDLTRPDIWQQFSPANLTPLLILSFEVDLILFGLQPALFYVHQLLALAAGAGMLALCLHLWCRPGAALAGGVLFLTGLPVMLVSEQLMTRHYAEGLVLALLALYGYVRYLRTEQLWVLMLASAAYLLACMAKEVYVPLPLLLLCVPDANVRQRLVASAPFFVILLVYALWRSYMLPSVGGGYADSSTYLDVAYLAQVLVSYASFPHLLTGSLWLLAVIVFSALTVVYLLRTRRFPWRALVVAALVLGPLAPLVGWPGIQLADRYLFVVWAALSFAVAFMADRSGQKTALAAVPLLAIVSVLHALPVRSEVAAKAEEFEVQGQFIWVQDASAAFVPTPDVAATLWFVNGLRDFKAGLGLGSSPVAVVDNLYLARSEARQLWEWQADCNCMVDISAQIPQRRSLFIEGLRPTEALSVTYAYQNGYFSWEFGPWQQGGWHLVSDEIGVIPAPASGQLRAVLADNALFYIRYTSPEGWFTYSDQLQVVRDGPQISWSRGSGND